MNSKPLKPLATSSRIVWKLSSCNLCDEPQEGHKANELCKSSLNLTVSGYWLFPPRRSSCQLNFKDFSEVWNFQNSSPLHSLPLFNKLINHSTSTKMASQSKCTRPEAQGIRKVNASWCLLLFHVKSMLPVALTVITYKNHTVLIMVRFLASIGIIVNDIQICVMWVICD